MFFLIFALATSNFSFKISISFGIDLNEEVTETVFGLPNFMANENSFFESLIKLWAQFRQKFTNFLTDP